MYCGLKKRAKKKNALLQSCHMMNRLSQSRQSSEDKKMENKKKTKIES